MCHFERLVNILKSHIYIYIFQIIFECVSTFSEVEGDIGNSMKYV